MQIETDEQRLEGGRQTKWEKPEHPQEKGENNRKVHVEWGKGLIIAAALEGEESERELSQ